MRSGPTRWCEARPTMSHSFGIVRLGDEMDIDSESHGAGVTSDFIPWLTQVNHRSNHRQY